jgi:AbrB family looped-hinge helix DNA binding protein
METVKLSPKYQIVIPKSVRDALALEPGQHLDMVVVDGRIEVIPAPSAEDARGFLEGIDTRVPRDDDRA